MLPLRHRLMIVVWPAFLTAGLLEVLGFALVDPQQLHWPQGVPLEMSTSVVYTVAFFVFWFFMVLAGSLTQLLQRTAHEVNHLPDDVPTGRPDRAH